MDMDGIQKLDEMLRCLKEAGRVQPGGDLPGNPVDLRGLAFPTVSYCRELRLEQVIVDRVCGRQEVSGASFTHVDLSSSVLDHSTWNDCAFENVLFDCASLRNVRFFGCRFTRCSFTRTDLSDASISVGPNGEESQLLGCRFDRCDLRGASCHRPVLVDTALSNCRLGDFVFDEGGISNMTIRGTYDELAFRGSRGEPERNRLVIDLADAKVGWLNVDYGVDLSAVKLPSDGSCVVLTDRLRACEALLRMAERSGSPARSEALQLLGTVFSDESPSPLDPSQAMFCVSVAMLQELGQLGEGDARGLLADIRESLTRESVVL